MRYLMPLFNVIYGTIALLFFLASVTLLVLAGMELRHAVGSAAEVAPRAARAI